MKRIEILYFDSCPGWQGAVDRVHEVLQELGLDALVSIELISVATEREARNRRFLGSPTIRIDGRDVEPGSEELTSYGLHCRVYPDGGRLEGLPPKTLIGAALGATSTSGSKLSRG
jgi:hypothetical protein